jgi:hypothetical protein
LGFWWLVVRDHRQDLPLSTFEEFNGSGYGGVFDGLRDDTADLCDGRKDCVEGYEGENLQLYRFGSKQAAAAFAGVTAGSHQSSWIVMVFDPSLTGAQRAAAAQLVDRTWSSE